jgi:hypothetical protein
MSVGFISGQVRARGGGAVAGAHVCATETTSQSEWQPHVLCVEADALGRYRIALVAGRYTVGAEAVGYIPGSAANGEGIKLGSGSTVSDADILLESGGSKVAGVVLDATGGPIHGARIRVTRQMAPHNTSAVLSDEDGHFLLWATSGPLTIMAEANGYTSARVYRVAPTTDLVFRLMPAATVSGDVAAAGDGHLLQGMVVRAVFPGSPPSAVLPSANTDANGAFALVGLDPGEYTLVAEGLGWRGTSTATLHIGLAEHREHVHIVAQAAFIVDGQVLTEHGSPCDEGGVQLGPIGVPDPFSATAASSHLPRTEVPVLSSSIDSSGKAHFPAVPGGNYRAFVYCAGHVVSGGPTELAVVGDVRDVVWTIGSGAGLTLSFVDEVGSAVPGVSAYVLFPQRGAGPRPRIPITADPEGHYVFRDELYPGTYTVEPFEGYDADPVDVVLGTDRAQGVVRLRGAGTIAATVLTTRGVPVDDLTVYAVSAAAPDTVDGAVDPGARGPTRVDAVARGNGHFEIGPLRVGRYRVYASDGMNPPVSNDERGGDLDLTVHGHVAVTLRLDRAGSISGHVVNSDNQPVLDALINVLCEAPSASEPESSPLVRHLSPAQRVVSDSEGRFTVNGLATDARCAIHATGVGKPSGVAKDVHVGDTVTMVLPEWGRLSGPVDFGDITTATQIPIIVQDTGTGAQRELMARVNGGRWAVDEVQPGSLHIVALAGNTSASQDVELASGASLENVRLSFRTAQVLQGPAP